MQEALIESEDKRFYEHRGVDWEAVLGAAWDRLLTDSPRGASHPDHATGGHAGSKAGAPPRRPHAEAEMGTDAGRAQTGKDLEPSRRSWRPISTWRSFAASCPASTRPSWGLFQKHPSGLNKAEASCSPRCCAGPTPRPARWPNAPARVAAELSPPPPGMQDHYLACVVDAGGAPASPSRTSSRRTLARLLAGPAGDAASPAAWTRSCRVSRSTPCSSTSPS